MREFLDRIKSTLTEDTGHKHPPRPDEEAFSLENVRSEVATLFDEGARTGADLDSSPGDVLAAVEEAAAEYDDTIRPALDEHPGLIGDDIQERKAEWRAEYVPPELTDSLAETTDTMSAVIGNAFDLPDADGDEADTMQTLRRELAEYPAINYFWFSITYANAESGDE